MHDSDYQNIRGLKLVHDAEWKSLNKAAPDGAARERAAHVRMGNNFAQGAFDLPNKVRAQAGRASFVEPSGCDKFAFRQRVKDERVTEALHALSSTPFQRGCR
jgi:hypothetical protein